MKCPKCGTQNKNGEWLCSRCETILDPSFLGDDILNEATRSGARRDSGVGSVITAPVDPKMIESVILEGAPSVQTDPVKLGDKATSPEAAPGASAGWDDPAAFEDPSGLDFGDSVILGRIGDSGGKAVLSNRTGAFLPVKLESRSGAAAPAASVFIGGDVAELLSPDSVPRRVHDADARRHVLSPFEAEVLALVDGSATLEFIRAHGDLSGDDVRVAMAMLLDKKMIEVDGPATDSVVEKEAEQPDDDSYDRALDDHTNELGDLPPLAAAADQTMPLEAPKLPPPFAAPDQELPAPNPVADPSALSVPVRDDARHAPPRIEAPAVRPSAPPVVRPVPPPVVRPVPPPVVRPAPPPVARPAPPPPVHAAADADAAPAVRPAARPAMRVNPVTSIPPRPRRPSDMVDALPPSPRAAPAGPLGLPSVPKPVAPSAAPRAKARAAELYETCMRDLAAGRVGRAWGYAKMAAEADPQDERLQTLLKDWNRIVAQQSSGPVRPMSPQELLTASQKAEQEGDIPQAVAHMRKITEIAKGSAAAWNRLGVLLATRGRQYRAGYDAVMRAVELEPGNLTYQSNMMKILEKVDDAEEPEDDGKKRTGLLGKMLKR